MNTQSTQHQLGILGGGQLGRMLAQAAIDWNVSLKVLDPSAEAPCKGWVPSFVQGSLTDYDTVVKFGADCEVITVEIEHVNTEALRALKAAGKKVYPDPDILAMIQNKRLQKQFFAQHGFPTSPFQLVEADQDWHSDISLPSVWKSATAGYDGRGVKVLRSAEDIAQLPAVPGLVEDFVPFQKELAIIAARNAFGEITTFPLVEMVFHPVHNLVQYLLAPARIPGSVEQQAEALAHKVLQELGYVGLMAIELFLTKENELLINEMAPRPHNSGHHSIEACLTSQYQQHLRAILGYPLGDTTQHSAAAMVNLLGADGHTGIPKYVGLAEGLGIPGLFPHLYGKHSTRPFRKMGHVTLLETEDMSLEEKIAWVEEYMRVEAI